MTKKHTLSKVKAVKPDMSSSLDVSMHMEKGHHTSHSNTSQKSASSQQKDSAAEDKQTQESSKAFFIFAAAIIAILALFFLFSPGYTQKVATTQLVTTNSHAPSTETLEQYTYSGIDFQKYQGFWHAELPGPRGEAIYALQFYYGPRELEQVPVSQGWFGPAFQNKEVIVTFDPTDKNFTFLALAVGQLDTSLVKAFQKDLIAACAVNETDACVDRPIINCENANDQAVFFLKEAPQPQITFDGNCVLIEGEGWDLVKATESLLLRAYSLITPDTEVPRIQVGQESQPDHENVADNPSQPK